MTHTRARARIHTCARATRRVQALEELWRQMDDKESSVPTALHQWARAQTSASKIFEQVQVQGYSYNYSLQFTGTDRIGVGIRSRSRDETETGLLMLRTGSDWC